MNIKTSIYNIAMFKLILERLDFLNFLKTKKINKSITPPPKKKLIKSLQKSIFENVLH